MLRVINNKRVDPWRITRDGFEVTRVGEFIYFVPQNSGRHFLDHNDSEFVEASPAQSLIDAGELLKNPMMARLEDAYGARKVEAIFGFFHFETDYDIDSPRE